MKFKFIFEDKTSIYYDNQTNSFSDSQGNNVVPREESSLPTALRFSPNIKPVKTGPVKRLKIQLGLKCNYSCSYCLQALHVPDATISTNSDVDEFISKVDSWLDDSVERIEFWGGEPLLYWKKIKRLAAYLKEFAPNAQMSIVTNGSLLNEAIAEDIASFNMGVAISHDGPAQHLRGPDPFDDPEKYENIRNFIVNYPNNFGSFNAVISPDSADINKTVQWFRDKLDLENVPVSFEGVVIDYDSKTQHFSEETYDVLHDSITDGMKDGRLWEVPAFYLSVNNFMRSVRAGVEAKHLTQKCGMEKPESLAVDLQGNVMTCQNVSAKGKHLLGNVYDNEPIELGSSWHWSQRRECPSCPVLHLCKGSCMYLDKDSSNWAVSCENEFRLNLALLTAALYQFFGKELVEIQGDVVRPQLIPTLSV